MSIMFSRTGHGNGRYSIGCQGCESTGKASLLMHQMTAEVIVKVMNFCWISYLTAVRQRTAQTAGVKQFSILLKYYFRGVLMKWLRLISTFLKGLQVIVWEQFFFFESGPVLMHHHNPDKSSSSVSTADNQAELLNKQPDGISHVSHKWVKAIYYNYFN